MSSFPAASLAVPSVARSQAATIARTSPERGRKLILWGWMTTMAGVACYCRAIFAMGPEADALDAVTQSGTLGWVSAILVLGGVSSWLTGNLFYLHDAMEAPAIETGDPANDPDAAP